jgi:hypothetical protein
MPFRTKNAPSLRDSVGIIGIANPTLKRGANNHCAYGAGDGPLPAWSASTKAYGSAGGYLLSIHQCRPLIKTGK